ncbi:glycine cleavage system protein H [Lentilactobacillus senioris]|nr:glycine cleavage system protein H [Lentilactobacillus senioris]
METKYYWMNEVDGVTTIGLSQTGRDEFGNISFATLPKVDSTLAEGDTLLNIEADKAVSDLATPIAGKVIEINQELKANPDLLNSDDQGISWIAKIKA